MKKLFSLFVFCCATIHVLFPSDGEYEISVAAAARTSTSLAKAFPDKVSKHDQVAVAQALQAHDNAFLAYQNALYQHKARQEQKAYVRRIKKYLKEASCNEDLISGTCAVVMPEEGVRRRPNLEKIAARYRATQQHLDHVQSQLVTNIQDARTTRRNHAICSIVYGTVALISLAFNYVLLQKLSSGDCAS